MARAKIAWHVDAMLPTLHGAANAAEAKTNLVGERLIVLLRGTGSDCFGV